MKKIIAFILILLCLTATAEADLYYRFGNIVDLEWDSDCVTADDGIGNLWEFYGCDYFFFDDLIVMIIDDNGTAEYIYDDIVVNAYGITAEDAQILIKNLQKNI